MYVDGLNGLYMCYAAHLDGPGQVPNFMCRIAYFANIQYRQTHEVGVEQAVALLDQALSALNTKKYVRDKDTLSIMFISCSNVSSSRLES